MQGSIRDTITTRCKFSHMNDQNEKSKKNLLFDNDSRLEKQVEQFDISWVAFKKIKSLKVYGEIQK